MRSLRARLIVGSSLVAVIPLAVAIYLLSQRVETMVRTQAAERLNAALGGLQGSLRSERERVAEKLQILARDPQLRRLYLLRPAGGRDLSQNLEERRFLLGLGFLEIADTSGTVVSRGSMPPSPAPGLTITASAPIRYESQIVGQVEGGLSLDAAFLDQLKRTGGVELVLRDGAGQIAATTLGEGPPPPIPAPGNIARVSTAGRSFLSRSFPLEIGAPPHASVTGLVSTAAADQAIATLQRTALLLGLLGLGIAVVLGLAWSSQVSRPVERLAAYSRKLAQGNWDEPLTLESVGELQTLVLALDQMREDLATYRSKLVASERHAAWSQMARKVAHEIKNPLTPIAVSVADLKRSYEQQRADFPEVLDQAVRTIADEVETLKRLLQEFADFARLPAPRLAPCRLSTLWADLGTLYGRDVSEGRLSFSRLEVDIPFSADAGQVRQALVNLIQNGLEALNGKGRVGVSARVDGPVMEIAVSDTGPGLSAEQRAQLFTPGFTTKTHGSGLGLTIVERIVSDHRGVITVDAAPGCGTTVRIRLPLEPGA